MDLLDSGFAGRTCTCIVSCHKNTWKTAVAAAKSKGDSLAALFEPSWETWKMIYGGNVERYASGTSNVTKWIVIHGPGGPGDLGKAQAEEVSYLSSLKKL
eukprot:8715892-Pyramimonas_sp.AAC.1